ncbi:MAG: AmmeMemoRadiSam system radical SAM enzyme [Deltaproteobacteria bacterium]|nr:AmmeMemoRadiSam system radical SAM enzyme [Deltaproteobacteria bacterium]
MVRDAILYRKTHDGKLHCRLCSHHCRVAEGEFGFCGVRENRDGRLVTHVYGEVIAANVDPIEKKPLYHFLPGSSSFSIATLGCNFRCGFCQNWQISQLTKEDSSNVYGRKMTPEQIVDEALRKGCRSISYTYTEPTVFFEYAYDTAVLSRERGLANIFVTNGYMSREALSAIRPYLDAANVDLKSFSDEFYKRNCKAKLKPVLATIRSMKEMGVWLEVTTLVIPGENDDDENLAEIARFIASVDGNIPWHISRFHPDFQLMDSQPTPMESLLRAYRFGEEAGLRYIYLGNVSGETTPTRCPQCWKPVINRRGYEVDCRLKKGACPECGGLIPGVF